MPTIHRPNNEPNRYEDDSHHHEQPPVDMSRVACGAKAEDADEKRRSEPLPDAEFHRGVVLAGARDEPYTKNWLSDAIAMNGVFDRGGCDVP